jgi:hypothetical protein
LVKVRNLTLLMAMLGLILASTAYAAPKKGNNGNKGNKGQQAKLAKHLKPGSVDGGVAFLSGAGNWNLVLTSTTAAPTAYDVQVCFATKTRLLLAEKKGKHPDTRAGTANDCDKIAFKTGKGLDGVRAIVPPMPVHNRRASDRPPVRMPIVFIIKKDGKPVAESFLKGHEMYDGDGTFLFYSGGPGKGAKKAKRPKKPKKPKPGKADGGTAFLGGKGNWKIVLTSATKAPTKYTVSVCGAKKTKGLKLEKKGKHADKKAGRDKDCDN